MQTNKAIRDFVNLKILQIPKVYKDCENLKLTGNVDIF